MKKYPVVACEWVDSCGIGRWGPMREHLEHEPNSITSVGYLVRTAKSHITLLQTLDPSHDNGDNSVMIVRSAIKKLTYLEERSKKK